MISKAQLMGILDVSDKTLTKWLQRDLVPTPTIQNGRPYWELNEVKVDVNRPKRGRPRKGEQEK